MTKVKELYYFSICKCGLHFAQELKTFDKIKHALGKDPCEVRNVCVQYDPDEEKRAAMIGKRKIKTPKDIAIEFLTEHEYKPIRKLELVCREDYGA